jgi:hypothetical protein
MSSLQSQRGGATLIVAVVLGFLALLVAGFAHRGLVFEQRAAANLQRASQAFEAGEAGIEWALAQLNRNARIDERCEAGDAAAQSFRDRHLERALAAQPLDAACTLEGDRWSCHCPANGPATRPPTSAVGFTVRVTADTRRDMVRIEARGCVGSADDCASNDASARPDAVSTSHVLAARLPGLGVLPVAALTVRGNATLGERSLGVHHTATDGSGLTVHAGGALDLAAARLSSVPGAPVRGSVLDQDPALSALDANRLFATVFRLSHDAWRQQPVVRQLRCDSACDDTLQRTIGPDVTNPLLWLEGGMVLNRAATIGTPQRPVLLVVNGPVEWSAPVVVHGVIYVTSPRWSDTAGGQVHGAVIAESDFHANANTDIRHNADTIERLHRHAGTFARVPGSWRDFQDTP